MNAYSLLLLLLLFLYGCMNVIFLFVLFVLFSSCFLISCIEGGDDTCSNDTCSNTITITIKLLILRQ